MIPQTNISWQYAMPLIAYLVGGLFFVWVLLRAAAKPDPKPPGGCRHVWRAYVGCISITRLVCDVCGEVKYPRGLLSRFERGQLGILEKSSQKGGDTE